jgi:hypothetical protein
VASLNNLTELCTWWSGYLEQHRRLVWCCC